MIKFENILLEGIRFPYFTKMQVKAILRERARQGIRLPGNMDALAGEILDVFIALPNPIPIFRVLAINSEKEIDLKNPGTSWTFDLQSLQYSQTGIYGGDETGKSKWAILSALIDKKDVDWYNTIAHYVAYSVDELYGGDAGEDEIKISDAAYLMDLKIAKIINYEEPWV